MIRLFLRLLKIRDFEPCKSCETLRTQLEIANSEKKELTKTLLGLLNPRLVEQPPQELAPIIPRGMPWARRRVALEERDAAEAKAKQSVFAAEVPRPDKETVERLERELGVAENAG